MRKTKLICTIGPACEDEQILEEMCLAGMNVARLNFSHGTHEEHGKKIELIKKVREKLNLPIPIMLDTKGPEYRIRTFRNGKVFLHDGDDFTFTTEDIIGDEHIVSVNFKQLMENLEIGDTILVNNGLVIFKVVGLSSSRAKCKVIVGGELSNSKSMNFPNRVMKHEFLSEQDKEDLLFGIENQVDFVAASFVSCKQDMLDMRIFLDSNNGKDIDIIAKIENRSGVNNIDEICEVADGIMIARGDLGVEIPAREVPSIQKYLIQKCRMLGKRVITATEMLESMIYNPRPTRAELSDVANAVYDETSAVMLSGETAAGKYPVEALQTMVKIARRTEDDVPYNQMFSIRAKDQTTSVTNAISHATCMTAIDLGAKAIITVTHSGNTSRMVSKYRPGCLIVGCSPDERICRQLNLSWGVAPIYIKEEYSMEILLLHATEAAEKAGHVKQGDVVVLTVGVPLGRPGNTNLMKAAVVGEY